jgi:hypothetical protein
METLREAYGLTKQNDGAPKVEGASLKDIGKQGKIDKWIAARREALACQLQPNVAPPITSFPRLKSQRLTPPGPKPFKSMDVH